MNEFHVAVIGTGSFGRHHARHLASHPFVGRLSVIDRDLARAEEIAAPLGAGAFADHSDIDPDAAVIAVPTEAHAEIALPLLERGVACFIEKPIAATMEEANALLAAAARGGALLQVGHIERFSAPFEALSNAVAGPQTIEAKRHNTPRPVQPTVDVVLDLMIHDIDLALSLAKSPVVDVTVGTDCPDHHNQAHARLAFENGVMAELSASRIAGATDRALSVAATNGCWHADLAGTALRYDGPAGKMTVPIETGRDNLGVEIDAFVRAVVGRHAPLVDGSQGTAALAVALAVRDALGPSGLLSA